jgi:hypothetical protein
VTLPGARTEFELEIPAGADAIVIDPDYRLPLRAVDVRALLPWPRVVGPTRRPPGR